MRRRGLRIHAYVLMGNDYHLLGMGHYSRVSRMRRRPGRKLQQLRRRLAQATPEGN
jgi:hypothetical protein